VHSCLSSAAAAIRSGESLETGTPAGTIVVRAAGLRVHGMTVATGDGVPSAGELAVFCRPVITAPAVIRRDGTVLAGAWLPDLVRLGELEAHLGDGMIEALVDAAVAAGRLKPRQRRRIMSYPLVIRLMIAMTLMPDASYCEALARLAGLLADVPFAREWHVPAEKVVTDWRLPVPPGLMEDLFWRAAGPLIGDGEPSAVMLAGMPVAAADGMLVNLADTPANRVFFGSTGTADDSSPFPQLRIVAVTARAGRAMLGAILGQAGTGEQTLLKRLVKRRPGLVAGRVICFDRNFPGHDLITAILDAGGHVVARVKEGISLGSADGPGRGWLPDGSRMTWLNAPSGKRADRLPVRAAEHNATMPGVDGHEQVSQTCTIITTLVDHETAPAGEVRDAYLTRWSAAETTFGEDKSAIAGAGNRTSGPVLRSGSPRMVIQEAWAWLAGTQLVRASEAAALRSEHAAARALRRRSRVMVTADEESFTAARHHAIRSMTSTQVTATSTLEALAAAADSAARACLHTLNLPGRQRHSGRAQKARPKFPHATATKTTVTGKPQVTMFAPRFC
jgi:Insertion element 4 transposase N-terminal/Transposase DDE domain